MTTGLWIALGTAANAIIALAFGYLRSRPLVPAYTVAELRETIKELRERVEELQEENKNLLGTNRSLEWSRSYWEDQYRSLRDKNRGDC